MGKMISRRAFLKGSAATAAALGLAPHVSPGWAQGKNSIKIGGSLSLTGKYAYTGERMHEGFKTWEKLINEKGYSPGCDKLERKGPGLLGRPVELLIYDDQSDPATAVKLYQKLVTADKVDLVLAPYSSAIVKAISPLIEKFEMPMVASAAQDPGIWRGMKLKWTVQAIATTDAMFQPIGEIGGKYKSQTAAIVFEDTAFPIALANSTKAALEKNGVKIVLFEAYPKGITDWTPSLKKAMSMKPDIVGIGGYEPDAIGLTKAAQAIKAQPKMFVWTVATQAPYFAESVGDACFGMVGDLLWAPTLNTNGNAEFVKALEQHAKTPANKQVQHQAFGFTGCQLVEVAVKKAGSLDRKAIRDKLFETEFETVQGPYKVAPLSSPDSGVQLGLAGFIIQWQKKKAGDEASAKITVGNYVREVVWPEKYKTASLIYPFPGWDK
ncbi:MAG TPA: amino acid ABC transporter substrate-binding protein [Thermodesulfobacteriota bacterium]|nr:amino acid ABC transporter substrate-binding protein [Thermodesulfobacteriota bacterium]